MTLCRYMEENMGPSEDKILLKITDFRSGRCLLWECFLDERGLRHITGVVRN